MKNHYTAAQVLEALDQITGGRIIRSHHDAFGSGSAFVVTKTSNIPGKAITETPGLVCGPPDHVIRKIAVSMTLTESQLELAGATGVDAIVCHHPVADGASCGGVPLRVYAGLYNIAIFEIHEAFHGRHPGMAFLHGHRPFRVELEYGGIPGNVVLFGRALPEVRTVGDILKRLEVFADFRGELRFLELERRERRCPTMMESAVGAAPKILNGTADSPVTTVLHFFPHTGFGPNHLMMARKECAEIDCLIVSVSRTKDDSPLVVLAKELGLPMVAGNSHALEILENGVPLAYALQSLLPEAEVVIFRERVTEVPLEKFGSPEIREYGRQMAFEHLLKEKMGKEVARHSSGKV
jgi:hypothetical protein